MPRGSRVRVLPKVGPATVRENEGRVSWLSGWKERAIRRLPASASPAARSRLRQTVERALARFNVHDPEDEIRDAVDAAIEPMLHALAEREAAATRERRKQEHLEQIEAYLAAALSLRAGPATRTMLKHPAYAQPVLAERLRRRWRRELTGEESDEALFAFTLVFVDRCLAKQPLPPRRWPRRIATSALVTTAAIATALGQNPELRELAGRGFAAGQRKLRGLLARATSSTKAPRG